MSLDSMRSDMRLMGLAFCLHGRKMHAMAAFKTAEDTREDDEALTVLDIASMIRDSGLGCAAVHSDQRGIPSAVEDVLRVGCMVLGEFKGLPGATEPHWRMLTDSSEAEVDTVAFYGPGRKGVGLLTVGHYLTGRFVVVLDRCPFFEGNWNTAVARFTPVQ